MKFREYESKPITRKAYRITDLDDLMYTPSTSSGKVNGLEFQAYDCPVAGDYVVYLNANDIYHCRKEVFEDRNVVNG